MKYLIFCFSLVLASCHGPANESSKPKLTVTAKESSIVKTVDLKSDPVPQLPNRPSTDLEKVKPFLDEWYRRKIKEHDYPWDELLKEHPDLEKPNPKNAILTDSTIDYPNLLPACCSPSMTTAFKRDLNRDGRKDLVLEGGYAGPSGFSSTFTEYLVFLGTDSGFSYIGSITNELLDTIVRGTSSVFSVVADRKGNLKVSVPYYQDGDHMYPSLERDVKFRVTKDGLKFLKLGRVRKSDYPQFE